MSASTTLVQWPDHLVPIATHPMCRIYKNKSVNCNNNPNQINVNDENNIAVYHESTCETIEEDSVSDENVKILLLNLLKLTPPCFVIDVNHLIEMNILNIFQAPYIATKRSTVTTSSPRRGSDVDSISPTFNLENTPIAAVSLIGAVLEISHNDDDCCCSAVADVKSVGENDNQRQVGIVKQGIVSFSLTIPNHGYRYILYMPPALMMLSKNDVIQRRCSFCHGNHIYHTQDQIDTFMGKMKQLKHYIDVANRHHMNMSNFQPCLIRIKIELMSQSSMEYFSSDMVMEKMNRDSDDPNLKSTKLENQSTIASEDQNVYQEKVVQEQQNQGRDGEIISAYSDDTNQGKEEKCNHSGKKAQLTEEDLRKTYNLERRKFNRESCAGLKAIFVNLSTEDPDVESGRRRRWDEPHGDKKKEKNTPSSLRNPRQRGDNRKAENADLLAWNGGIEYGEAKNKFLDSPSSDSLSDKSEEAPNSTNIETGENESSDKLIEKEVPDADDQISKKKSVPNLYSSNIFKQNFTPYHKKHNNEFQFLNKNEEEPDAFCPNRGFKVIKSTFGDSQKKTGASIALVFSSAAVTQMHLRVGLDHATIGKLIPLRVIRPVLDNVVGTAVKGYVGGHGITYRKKGVQRNSWGVGVGVHDNRIHSSFSLIHKNNSGSMDDIGSLVTESYYNPEEEKMMRNKFEPDTDGHLLGSESVRESPAGWHFGDAAKELWWSKQAPLHSITIGEILSRHRSRETAAVVELVSTNTTKTRMKYGAEYGIFASKELIEGPIVRGRLFIWAEPLPQTFELFHFSLIGLIRRGGNLGPPTYSDPVMKLSVLVEKDRNTDMSIEYQGSPQENSVINGEDGERLKQIKEREREWELKRLRQIADNHQQSSNNLLPKNYYISEGYRNRHAVNFLPIPIAYSTEKVLDPREVFIDATMVSTRLLSNLIDVESYPVSGSDEVLIPMPPSLPSKTFHTSSSNAKKPHIIASSLLSSKVLPPIAVVKKSGENSENITTLAVQNVPTHPTPVLTGKGRNGIRVGLSDKQKDRKKRAPGGANITGGYMGTGYSSLEEINHEFLEKPQLQCPRSPLLTTYRAYKNQLVQWSDFPQPSSHISKTAGRRGGNDLLKDNDTSQVLCGANQVLPMIVCPKELPSMRNLELFIDLVDGIRRSTIRNIAEQQRSLQAGSSTANVQTVKSKIQEELAQCGIRTALLLTGVKDDGVVCPLRIAHATIKIGDVIQSRRSITPYSTSLTALSSSNHQECLEVFHSDMTLAQFSQISDVVTKWKTPPGGFISLPMRRNYMFDGKTITDFDQMNLMRIIYSDITASCYSDFPPSLLRQFLEKRAMLMISAITDGNLLSAALLAPLRLLQSVGIGLSAACVGISEVDRKRRDMMKGEPASGTMQITGIGKPPATNGSVIKSALKTGGKPVTGREGGLSSGAGAYDISNANLALLQSGNSPTANTLVPFGYRVPPIANITHIPFYRTVGNVLTPSCRSRFSFLDFLRSRTNGHEIHCVSALDLGTRVSVFRKVTRYLDRSFNRMGEINAQKRPTDPLPSVEFEVEYQKVTKRCIAANHSPCFLNGWTAVEGILASLQQLLEPFVFRNTVSHRDKIPQSVQSTDVLSYTRHSDSSVKSAFEESSLVVEGSSRAFSDCTNSASMSLLPPGDFLVFFTDVNVRQVCDDEGDIPDTNDEIDQMQQQQPEMDDEHSDSSARRTRKLYVREHSYESHSMILPLNVEGELNISVPASHFFKYNPWHSKSPSRSGSGRKNQLLYQPYGPCSEFTDLVPENLIASPVAPSKNCDGSVLPNSFTLFKNSWFGINSNSAAPDLHQEVATENHSDITCFTRKGRLTTNIADIRMNLSSGIQKRGQTVNKVKSMNSGGLDAHSAALERKLKDIPVTDEGILNIYADGVEGCRLVDQIQTSRYASSGTYDVVGKEVNEGGDENQLGTNTVDDNKIKTLYELGVINNDEEASSYPLKISLVYDEDFEGQYRHRLVVEAETARFTLENQKLKELELENKRQKTQGNKNINGVQNGLVDSRTEDAAHPTSPDPSEPQKTSEDLFYERQEEEMRKEHSKKQLVSQRTLANQHSSSNLLDVLEAIVLRCEAKSVARDSLARKEEHSRQQCRNDLDKDTYNYLPIDSQESSLLLNPRDQRLVFQHHHYVSSSTKLSLNPRLFHIGNVIVTHPIRRKCTKSYRAAYFSSSPTGGENYTDDEGVELVPQSDLDSILTYLQSIAHLPIIFLFIFVNCEAPEELGMLPNVITTDYISLTGDLLREISEDKQSNGSSEMITVGSPAATAAYQSRTAQEDIDLKVDIRRNEANQKRWLEEEANAVKQDTDKLLSPITSSSTRDNSKEAELKTLEKDLIATEGNYKIDDTEGQIVTEPTSSIADERKTENLLWEQRALKVKEKRREIFMALHFSTRNLQKAVGTIPSMFINYCRAQLTEEEMPIDSTDAYYDPDELVETAEIEEEEKLEEIRQKELAEKMAKMQQAELLRGNLNLVDDLPSTAISGYAIQDSSLIHGKKNKPSGNEEIRIRSLQAASNRRKCKLRENLQVYHPKGRPREEFSDMCPGLSGLYHSSVVEDETQSVKPVSARHPLYDENSLSTSGKNFLHSIGDWKFANGDDSCNRVAYLLASSKYKESMLTRPGCAPSTTGSGTAQQRQLLVTHSLTSRAAGSEGDPLEATVRLCHTPTGSQVSHAVKQSTLQYNHKFYANDPLPEVGLGFDSPYKKFVKGSDAMGEGHGLDTVNLTVLDVFMNDSELLEHKKHAADVCKELAEKAVTQMKSHQLSPKKTTRVPSKPSNKANKGNTRQNDGETESNSAYNGFQKKFAKQMLLEETSLTRRLEELEKREDLWIILDDEERQKRGNVVPGTNVSANYGPDEGIKDVIHNNEKNKLGVRISQIPVLADFTLNTEDKTSNTEPIGKALVALNSSTPKGRRHSHQKQESKTETTTHFEECKDFCTDNNSSSCSPGTFRIIGGIHNPTKRVTCYHVSMSKVGVESDVFSLNCQRKTVSEPVVNSFGRMSAVKTRQGQNGIDNKKDKLNNNNNNNSSGATAQSSPPKDALSVVSSPKKRSPKRKPSSSATRKSKKKNQKRITQPPSDKKLYDPSGRVSLQFLTPQKFKEVRQFIRSEREVYGGPKLDMEILKEQEAVEGSRRRLSVSEVDGKGLAHSVPLGGVSKKEKKTGKTKNIKKEKK